MEIGNNIIKTSPMLQNYLKNNGEVKNIQQPQIQTAHTITVFPGSDLLKAYLGLNETQGATQAANVQAVNTLRPDASFWQNSLRYKLRNNEATIFAVIPRTMNAQDFDGNGLIQGNEIKGNLVNAVGRLDEIKSMGINTLHILPIQIGRAHV